MKVPAQVSEETSRAEMGRPLSSSSSTRSASSARGRRAPGLRREAAEPGGWEGRERGQITGSLPETMPEEETRVPLGQGSRGAVLLLRGCSCGTVRILRRAHVKGNGTGGDRVAPERRQEGGGRLVRAERSTTNRPYKPTRPFPSVFLRRSFEVESK